MAFQQRGHFIKPQNFMVKETLGNTLEPEMRESYCGRMDGTCAITKTWTRTGDMDTTRHWTEGHTNF